LCEECKEEDILAEEFAKDYNLPPHAKIYKACGCKSCGYSGYAGRRSIGELLIMNDKVKNLLKTTTDEHTIKTELEKEGLKTIASQLKYYLLKGETSLDEAIRIGLGHG
jgi:general secretion pathway protein E